MLRCSESVLYGLFTCEEHLWKSHCVSKMRSCVRDVGFTKGSDPAGLAQDLVPVEMCDQCQATCLWVRHLGQSPTHLELQNFPLPPGLWLSLLEDLETEVCGKWLGVICLGGMVSPLEWGAWHWFCSPVFCSLTLVSFVRVLTDAPWPRGTPGRVSPYSVLLTPLCILVSLQAVSPVLTVSTLLTDMAARCSEGWDLSCARAPLSGSVPVVMGTVACAWWERQLLLLGSLGAGHQAGGPLVHAPSTLRTSHRPKP